MSLLLVHIMEIWSGSHGVAGVSLTMSLLLVHIMEI